MDRIDSLLHGTTTEPLSPSVKHALTFARNSINKYYSKTDLSNVYRIAMVLHPQLKLKYFQQHGWTQDWIRTAETLVREEFAKYDAPLVPAPVPVCTIYFSFTPRCLVCPGDDRQRHLSTTWIP